MLREIYQTSINFKTGFKYLILIHYCEFTSKTSYMLYVYMFYQALWLFCQKLFINIIKTGHYLFNNRHLSLAIIHVPTNIPRTSRSLFVFFTNYSFLLHLYVLLFLWMPWIIRSYSGWCNYDSLFWTVWY